MKREVGNLLLQDDLEERSAEDRGGESTELILSGRKEELGTDRYEDTRDEAVGKE